MARQSYGTTPWGAWFLEMLKAYDDSGRLSRGKTYANTGKVNSLVISGQTAGAKVKGNYSPWYHVYFKFPSLSKTNEDAIRSILEKHPIELAGLRAGIMSPALIEALKKKKVRLIPARWNLIERDCTCPDSGDPCKHMAAVLFLLAKEIDHDPRLLFKLAGFDIDSINVPETAVFEKGRTQKLGLLHEHPIPLSLRKDETLNEAADLSLGLSVNEAAHNPCELQSPLKFSLGESYLPLITNILPPEPNFTSSDFIIKLTEFYHKAVLNYGLNFYSQEKQSEKQEEKSVNPFLFARVKINIDNIRKQKRVFPLEPKSPLTVNIKLNETREINQTLLQAQNFYKTRNSLNEMSPSVKILFSLFALAGKLIQSSAFIPAVFTENKKLFIFWKSLSASSEIKADILKFAASLTKEFFVPVEKWGRLYCAELLLTALLTEYAVSLKFFPDKSYTKDKEIDNLFFLNEEIDISIPGKRNLDTVIYSWLSVLNYSNCGYEYRLTLDALKDDEFFLLSALVRKAKEKQIEAGDDSFALEAEAPFTELNIAAKKSKNPDDILRFPATLSAYLPALSILAIKKNVMLSREETGVFLQKSAKLLQRFGIDIVLPKSLKNILIPKPVISVKSVKGAGNVVSFFNLDDVLSYNRALMLGDTLIDIDEFKKLFLNKSGLVKFNDQFLLLDPEEVAKMLKALEKPADTKKVLQAVLSGNAVCSKPASEIIKNIFRQEDVPVPQNLNAELRPYQEQGYRWLYANIKSGFGCLLADDMGLGKTVQIISLMLSFKNSKEAESPFLVIAPASLLSNWEHEIAKFAPSLKTAVYHGAGRKFNTEADVIISTYQTMQKDIEKLKDKKVFCIILDEAQAIKNSGTKKAHAVKAIQARGRIALTGTPVENNLEDMRSIFDFFLPGYLGTADEFRKKWRIPIELHNSEIEADDLKKITSPFLLRRLKTDPKVISDLPDKIITNQYCNLTPEQLAIYENLVETELHKVMGAETKIERQAYVLKLLTALKQVCNHPRAYDKETPVEMKYSGKAAVLIELLNEIISSGEKAIIFSQYVGTLDILKNIIQKELGTDPLLLHGQMPASKRKKAVDVFQTDPAYRIFLISLKAGGTGLNLTAANRVIHFDLWYNPAVEDQATDRAFRIGQTKNVFVHRLICSGTFEEKIDEMIQKKREISGMSISAGETWISKLTNEELAGLFKS